jgi:hypothetical protein
MRNKPKKKKGIKLILVNRAHVPLRYFKWKRLENLKVL